MCVQIWCRIAKIIDYIQFPAKKWNEKNEINEIIWTIDKNYPNTKCPLIMLIKMNSVFRILFTKTKFFFFKLQISSKNNDDSQVSRYMKPFKFRWRIVEKSSLICWWLYLVHFICLSLIFPSKFYCLFISFTFSQNHFEVSAYKLPKYICTMCTYIIWVDKNNNDSNLSEQKQ